MKQLIFLTNELLNPDIQKEMKLPLTFISFGLGEGRMYKHFRNRSNFILTSYKGNVVYGALMLCQDFDFYSRILDAYMVCSKSTLLRNHNQDLHHRVEIDVTPIRFNTLDELSRLQYKEGESIKALTYVGNPKHPRISRRLDKTVSYRIIDGIDAKNFKQLYGRLQT